MAPEVDCCFFQNYSHVVSYDSKSVLFAPVYKNVTSVTHSPFYVLGDAGEIFGAATNRGWPNGYCFDAECPNDKITVLKSIT